MHLFKLIYNIDYMQGTEIARCIKKGSKEEITTLFESVYNEYFKLVYFVAFSYLKNEQKTEDIVQDTFLQFFEKCMDFRWVSQLSNVKAYLCSCAKNAAFKETKNQNRLSDVENIETLSAEEKEYVLETNLINMLEGIDTESIDIINDHIFLGLPFSEIARKKKVSINTIKSKYRRAIQNIRRKFKQ